MDYRSILCSSSSREKKKLVAHTYTRLTSSNTTQHPLVNPSSNKICRTTFLESSIVQLATSIPPWYFLRATRINQLSCSSTGVRQSLVDGNGSYFSTQNRQFLDYSVKDYSLKEQNEKKKEEKEEKL